MVLVLRERVLHSFRAAKVLSIFEMGGNWAQSLTSLASSALVPVLASQFLIACAQVVQHNVQCTNRAIEKNSLGINQRGGDSYLPSSMNANKQRSSLWLLWFVKCLKFKFRIQIAIRNMLSHDRSCRRRILIVVAVSGRQQ